MGRFMEMQTAARRLVTKNLANAADDVYDAHSCPGSQLHVLYLKRRRRA